MGKNPFIAAKSQPIKTVELKKSAGILDDYKTSKAMFTKEAEITNLNKSTSPLTIGGNLTVNGNATLGDNVADYHAINATPSSEIMLNTAQTATVATTGASPLSAWKLLQTGGGNNSASPKVVKGINFVQTITGNNSNNFGNSYNWGINFLQTDNTVASGNCIKTNWATYNVASWAGTNNGAFAISEIGGYFEGSGDLTGGNTSHKGGDFVASGTASANYGIYVTSSGATANYAIYTTGTAQSVFGGDITTPAIKFPSSTPTTMSGDVNNYELGEKTFIRLGGGAADRIVTGIVAKSDGHMLIIQNIGTTNKISFSNESASSSAANRIINANAGTTEITPNHTIQYIYDSTTARWREITHL